MYKKSRLMDILSKKMNLYLLDRNLINQMLNCDRSKTRCRNICNDILLECKKYESPTRTMVHYSRCEFDSNLTHFEAISNTEHILLKTSVPEPIAELVVGIFQMIWDNNFYFHDWEHIDSIVNNAKKLLKNLMSEWEKQQNNQPDDSVAEESDSDEINPDESAEVFTTCINIVKKIYPRADVYTIDDIIGLPPI